MFFISQFTAFSSIHCACKVCLCVPVFDTIFEISSFSEPTFNYLYAAVIRHDRFYISGNSKEVCEDILIVSSDTDVCLF